MKKIIVLLCILCFPLMATGKGNCNLTCYHWDCDINPQLKPQKTSLSSVRCGRVMLWVNKQQYDILTQYRRADVNMVLEVDGEYIDSPCVPGLR